MTRNLRHAKRYYSFVTPLTCINWWRVCIDEAQIVETFNRVSQMTSHLKHVHSWAVSGTPIGKSLHGITPFEFILCQFSYFTFAKKIFLLRGHYPKQRSTWEILIKIRLSNDRLGLETNQSQVLEFSKNYFKLNDEFNGWIVDSSYQIIWQRWKKVGALFTTCL